jgi:hypothetical protein
MIEELRTLGERLLDHGRHLGGDPLHDPMNEAEAHAGAVLVVWALVQIETAPTAASKLEVAKEALIEARAKLAHYGMHDSSCPGYDLSPEPCTCGLSQALAALEAK